MWFSKANITNIEKHDYSAQTVGYELLNTLLIHKDNPEKVIILQLMDKLNKQGFEPI